MLAIIASLKYDLIAKWDSLTNGDDFRGVISAQYPNRPDNARKL